MQSLVFAIASVLVAAAVVAIAIYARSASSSMLSPGSVFRRSLSAMAAIHDVHAIGRDTERQVEVNDPSSTGSWRIRGDCSTPLSGTLSRFSYAGKQIGLHPATTDQQYVMRVIAHRAGQVYSSRGWTVWTRTIQPPGRWHGTGVTHAAQTATSMCPSLILLRLRSGLPGPLRSTWRPVIGGRKTVHLVSAFNGQGGGETVELWIDPVTYRWVRARWSGWGAGCCHSYRSTFDYSRYNVPARIKFPVHPATKAALSQMLLPCAPLKRSGIDGHGVIDPRHRGYPTMLPGMFVVTRLWADVRHNMHLIIYSGHMRQQPHRGFIAAYRFNQCTGKHSTGGIFYAPPRVGVPAMTSVRGNEVWFKAGKQRGRFNLTSHRWRTVA